jgi:hypothetical protein
VPSDPAPIIVGGADEVVDSRHSSLRIGTLVRAEVVDRREQLEGLIVPRM